MVFFLPGFRVLFSSLERGGEGGDWEHIFQSSSGLYMVIIYESSTITTRLDVVYWGAGYIGRLFGVSTTIMVYLFF